jgi:hypothetical protein
VSFGNKQINNPDLFVQKICRDELQCTPTQFWDAVDHGVPVPRPGPEATAPPDPIPYGLVKALQAQGHAMTRIQALQSKTEALDLLSQGPA